jgi:hypothetical protein
MTTPGYRRVQIGGFGSGRPVPMDIWVLLGVVFVTFTLAQFAATAGIIGLLRLTPLAWRYGLVWQLGTYPFVGFGGPNLWFLLELFILGLFGKDVFWRLGRKSFWKLLAWSAVAAGLAAVVVDAVVTLLGGSPLFTTFVIMQGQHMLVVLMIAAFAVLYRDATILLFFILPVQARWFLWIEILFAFMAFLGTKDLAGFVGICTGVAVTYSLLTRGGLTRGLRGGRRELWLRIQQKWIRWRLGRLRKQRDFRVLEGEGRRDRDRGRGGDGSGDGDGVHRGPWVN